MPEENGKKAFAGKAGKIIIALLVIAFVSLLAVAVTLAMKDSFSSGVPQEVVQAIFASEDELAYSVDSDSVIAFRPYADGIVLLTDTAVSYVDENGSVSAEDTHTFISPAMSSFGSHVLIYSRLSDKLRIEKNCKTEKELTASSAILCCTVGKKGNYAVCTYNDSGYASRLKVFDSDNDAVFEWGCASEYIIAAALSDNGKYAAAVVTGALNAESYSKIVFFDFNYNTEKYSVLLADTAAYAVSFVDNKTLLVSADNGVHKIDFEGKDEVILSCVSGQMHRSDIRHAGLSAFCVAGSQTGADEVLHVFNKKAEKTASITLSGTVLNISCSDKYVAVAYRDRVELYNVKGELCKTVTTDLACVSAVTENNSIFILCVNGLLISPTD